MILPARGGSARLSASLDAERGRAPAAESRMARTLGPARNACRRGLHLVDGSSIGAIWGAISSASRGARHQPSRALGRIRRRSGSSFPTSSRSRPRPPEPHRIMRPLARLAQLVGGAARAPLGEEATKWVRSRTGVSCFPAAIPLSTSMLRQKLVIGVKRKSCQRPRAWRRGAARPPRAPRTVALVTDRRALDLAVARAS